VKQKVLVIDDDDSLRQVVEFFLGEAGYQVFSASSGEEGLRVFGREAPPVVITDIQMRGISGFEVLREVKATDPHALVIVITAFGTVENAVEAMKRGAFDYIAKTFSRDQVRLVVEKAMAFRGLEEENIRLRQRLSEQSLPSIIAASEKMQAVIALVRRVAASEATVLILGESGTGKEMIARAIHEHSERQSQPFVPVAYDWPGNVRELENAVERMLVLAHSSIIDERDLPPRVRLNAQRPFQGVLNLPDTGYSLAALEKEAISLALLRNDWNQTKAAYFLQIPRHVLVYRMEKFGIRKSSGLYPNNRHQGRAGGDIKP